MDHTDTSSEFKFVRCVEHYFYLPSNNMAKVYEITKLDVTGIVKEIYFSQHLPYETSRSEKVEIEEKKKYFLGSTFSEAAAEFIKRFSKK